MSFERSMALFSFILSLGTAILLFRVSQDPNQSAVGRCLLRALDSWYLRARWSAEPAQRIRRMAWGALLVSLVMLYAFVVDPPLRYR